MSVWLIHQSKSKRKEGLFVAALSSAALCHVTSIATTTVSVVDVSLLEYQEGKEQWLLWIINWPCCGL